MGAAQIRNFLAGVVGLAGLTGPALAVPGYTNSGLNLLAGPGVDYPAIAGLPPGLPVEIFGCLPGYAWCDIGVQDARGWVYSGGLQVVYGYRRVLLPGYAPALGLPLIGFNVDDYWGRHYRNRPWYDSRERLRGFERPGPGVNRFR